MKQNYLSGISKTWQPHMWMVFFLLVCSGAAIAQQSYTFTPCGATGSVGPTQIMVNNSYTNTNLMGQVTTMTNGIQTWTVPYSGNFRIEARGAQGGTSTSTGGLGATVVGEFSLNVGEVIQILVGQQGEHGSNGLSPGGGGGGSYVVRSPYNVTTAILAIAGGGSGGGNYPDSPGLITTAGGMGGVAGGINGNGGLGGTRGAGGGGFLTDGDPCTASTTYASPGRAFVNGGAGGFDPLNTTCTTTYGNIIASGGFGGGASHGGNCILNGGAGGGFSGGGGSSNTSAGGGGSLNQGINQVNTPSVNSGNGVVIITELCSLQAYASTSNSQSPVICPAESITLTTNAVGNYSWSTGHTTNSIVVAPGTSTAYAITGTSSLNCVATAIIGVSVNPTPTINVTASKMLICQGEAITLNATGGSAYAWTNGPSGGVYAVTPASTSVYTVTGSHTTNTCTTVETITIGVVVPNLTLPTNTQVCDGESVTLYASGATDYKWNFSSTGAVGAFVYHPLTTSNVTLVATTNSLGIDCPVTHIVQVKVNPLPTLNVFPAIPVICRNESNTLTVTGAQTYTWDSGTGNSIVITPSANVYYSVTGTDAAGCSSVFHYQAQTSNCTGINEANLEAAAIAVFPNPNKGSFTIKAESAMDLVLVNELGQELKEFKLEESSGYSHEFKDLKPGIYFVRLQHGNGALVQKVVVN